MRIGIDCSLVPGERVGVGQYAYNLVNSLSQVDDLNEYILYPVFYYIFHPQYKDVLWDNLNANFKLAYNRIPEKLLKVLWKRDIPYFNRGWLLGNVDIVHTTTFVVPEINPKKHLVTTIYDVSFVTHPQYHMQANVQHCYKGTLRALQKADHIIAISNYTKGDLINYFGAKEENITVTHLAAGSHFSVPLDNLTLNVITKKFDLPAKFILFVGSLEPRKNVISLIKAYSLLSKNIKAEHKLVIAGGKGWLNSDIKDMIVSLKLEGNVKFTGYITDEELKGLYYLASLFVYPSFYEGFGLPVLEAMSCGTPVITSNVSCLPEIVEDGAMLISPTDVEEISGAITMMLENDVIKQFYKRKAQKRVTEFSWEKCAIQTQEVYRKIID